MSIQGLGPTQSESIRAVVLTIVVAMGLAACGTIAGRDREEAAGERALEAADLAFARGQYEDATRQYDDALLAMPDDGRALTGLTRVRIAQENWEAALLLADRVRDSAEVPDRGLTIREYCRLLRSVAAARIARGEKTAQSLLDRILTDDRCPVGGVQALRAQAFVLEAEAALAGGDRGAAISAYRGAIVADPGRRDVDLSAARLLLADGQRSEALRWLSGALERNPEDRDLQRMMMDALGANGF